MSLLEVFRDPIWQFIGTLVTLLVGFIGFYYAGKDKRWLYLTAIILLLLIGSSLGAELQRRVDVQTPGMATGKIKQMDSIPFTAYYYGLGKDFVAPKYFTYFYVANGANSEKAYTLEFALPSQGDAAAGISFTFTDSQNLAEYDHLELTLTLGEPETRCDIFIRDITMNPNAPFVTLGGEVPTDINANLKGNTWRYSIPLKTYFKSSDLKAVKEIGFNAWRFEGKHTFIVSDIAFVKP